MTLGETIRIIINLKEEHKRNILENCINYFTDLNLSHRDIFTKEEKERYYNYINAMREILNIIGNFRNNLAHNQPIYNFNVKEFYSSKYNKVNYSLPTAKTTKEQYILNTKYMSYFANFFGTDKYNSFAGNTNIDLSWIIYIIYKLIKHLDKNTSIYTELTYVYQKYNIILTPRKIAINKYNLYEEMLNKLEEYSKLDFNILEISDKYDNKMPIKQNLISLNKKINDMKMDMKKLLEKNLNDNDCLKYTHFLFDKNYTKYTGIDKKFFDKLK